MITDINQLDFDKTYSYADYLTWKFQERLEIFKGKLFKMSPAPNTSHQKVSMRLTKFILQKFNNNPCNLFAAPFDVRLLDKNKSPKTVKYSLWYNPICVLFVMKTN